MIDRRWSAAGVVVAVAVLPLVLLGPGTDLDAGAVIRSGRSIVQDGDYVASRNPGAPVHEAAVGVLDAIGGTVAGNLGSWLAAIAVVVLLVALLHREGVARAPLAGAVVVANPWFVLAATSTVDFLWALAAWLGSAVSLRRGRPVLAGALAAVAIGARSSTALLVGGLLLAHSVEATGTSATSAAPRSGWASRHRTGSTQPSSAGVGRGGRRRGALIAGVVAAVGALLLYLPSFLAANSSLAFAQNDVPTSSFGVQVGRFAAKDLYFFGPFAAVVLLLCLPAVARALPRWRADFTVRLGLLTVLASQALFLRFPWKMGHLLPTLVGVALLLAVALEQRPRLLVALALAQLAYGLVNVQLLEPDNPNAATGATLTLDPGWGVVVVDTQCRVEDRGAWKAPTPERADAVWTCAKPWAG